MTLSLHKDFQEYFFLEELLVFWVGNPPAERNKLHDLFVWFAHSAGKRGKQHLHVLCSWVGFTIEQSRWWPNMFADALLHEPVPSTTTSASL